MRITRSEQRKLAELVGIIPVGGAPKSKYHNTRVEADGCKFDSKKELRRWRVLQALMAGGAITELRRQHPFDIVIGDVKVCTYRADFTYKVDGQLVVEDAKGFLTDVYKLKKKLMLAVHGVRIEEV